MAVVRGHAEWAHTRFVASGPREFPEVYAATVATTLIATKLSDLGAQVAGWPAHGREVVRWKSQDGAEIEGVLHKPADFEPDAGIPSCRHPRRPRPGCRGRSLTGSASFYPIDGWLAKGALVLEPNYRGCAGYGERSGHSTSATWGSATPGTCFRAWTTSWAGAGGQAWSADGLEPGRLLSAFLTTRHAARFRAISVGAGISNWITYYVNTDIHPFTRQYLKATPWRTRRFTPTRRP